MTHDYTAVHSTLFVYHESRVALQFPTYSMTTTFLTHDQAVWYVSQNVHRLEGINLNAQSWSVSFTHFWVSEQLV